MGLKKCSKWISMIVLISTALCTSWAYADLGASAARFKPGEARLRVKNKTQTFAPKRLSSMAKLKRLLSAKSVQVNQQSVLRSTAFMDMASPGRVQAAAAEGGTSTNQYSDTNVQVPGVDEGDSVKTDGQYIYKIADGKVRIIQAYPAENMAVLASLEFDDGFIPNELYIEGQQLVVIGTRWEYPSTEDKQADSKGRMAIWGYYGESRVLARVYSVADHAQPVLQREIGIGGNFLASRKIGENIYLVARKYPQYYLAYFADSVSNQPVHTMTRDNILPSMSDSLVNNGADFTLPLSNLYYFPNFVDPSYTIVAGIRLNALDRQADVKAYLGSGDTVYASKSNLYVSAADYNMNPESTSQQVSTRFYKFALNHGDINFLSSGQVPGMVLNSFSMDEHNGYFRIATTVQEWSQSGSHSWNNVYTLDGDMKLAGRLENLAEDERIYSARFMGDRCYLVTFRQVDPFFVIDLATPTAPKVLGELKIPGFSNYLHPYGDHYVLGFGQDTEANEWGGVTPSGMKLALFDVSNVQQPKQLHSLALGGPNTHSPLIWGDHKALWIDAERNLIGFPVSEYSFDNDQYTFSQTARVYSINLETGFEKRAQITHQVETASYENWDRSIQRLLNIEDQLYTLSETRIQANDLNQFQMTGFLDLPREEKPVCVYPLLADAAVDTCGVVDHYGLDDVAILPAVDLTVNVGEQLSGNTRAKRIHSGAFTK